jgi:hypothetical protein
LLKQPEEARSYLDELYRRSPEIARFVPDSEHVFALKPGGYGRLFSVSGVDEESLTDQEIESVLRGVEGALRGLPEGSALYQYMSVTLPPKEPKPLPREAML